MGNLSTYVDRVKTLPAVMGSARARRILAEHLGHQVPASTPPHRVSAAMQLVCRHRQAMARGYHVRTRPSTLRRILWPAEEPERWSDVSPEPTRQPSPILSQPCGLSEKEKAGVRPGGSRTPALNRNPPVERPAGAETHTARWGTKQVACSSSVMRPMMVIWARGPPWEVGDGQ